MGSEGDSDITQLSFQFQGISISVTKSRSPAVPLGLNPDTPPSEPGVGSAPGPRCRPLSPETVQREEPAASSSRPSSSSGAPVLEASGPSLTLPGSQVFLMRSLLPGFWLQRCFVQKACQARHVSSGPGRQVAG